MDLNASPVPEEAEETCDRHIEEYSAPEPEERVESAVDIALRREERRMHLKGDHIDDRSVQMSQRPYHDQFQSKSLKTYGKSRLPPGWLDCPPGGNKIFCMIHSKVPIGESCNDCIIPGKRYSFKQVINQQRVLGRKVLCTRKGVLFPLRMIDLTNTSRYCQTTDLKKEGIKHVKIQCKGQGSMPNNPSVSQFVYEVSQFLLRQKHAKKYVLVHCTHGHNRTGYMIIHYLMRSQLSMSVIWAIAIFAEVRPPGIYKPDNIDALYTFYHERKPEKVTCPPTPEWKRSEFDLNGEAAPDDDDGGSAAPVHES